MPHTGSVSGLVSTGVIAVYTPHSTSFLQLLLFGEPLLQLDDFLFLRCDDPRCHGLHDNTWRGYRILACDGSDADIARDRA